MIEIDRLCSILPSPVYTHINAHVHLTITACRRCAFVRIEATQDHRLIADQPCGAIQRMGIAALGLEIRLGARDKEASGLVRPAPAATSRGR
jgi:hypothetical protein